MGGSADPNVFPRVPFTTAADASHGVGNGVRLCQVPSRLLV